MDRNDKDGEIMLFAKNGIITFSLDRYSFLMGFEAFCIELPFVFITLTIDSLKIISKNWKKLLNFTRKLMKRMGDFKAEILEPNLASLCTIYILKNFIKKPTCYKNPDNPSCTDLILTNCPNYFQNSLTFETGLSDFHKLILTLFKSEILQQRPNIVSYRNYKRYDSQPFQCNF